LRVVRGEFFSPIVLPAPMRNVQWAMGDEIRFLWETDDVFEKDRVQRFSSLRVRAEARRERSRLVFLCAPLRPLWFDVQILIALIQEIT
jgi:hypothetical protein